MMTIQEAADLLRVSADDAYYVASTEPLMSIVLTHLLKDIQKKITEGVSFETTLQCLLDDRSHAIENLQASDWVLLKKLRIPDSSIVYNGDGIDCVIPTRSDDRLLFDPNSVGVEDQRLLVVSINDHGVLITGVQAKRNGDAIEITPVNSTNLWVKSQRKWVKASLMGVVESGWASVIQQSVKHVLGSLFEKHKKLTPEEVLDVLSKVGATVIPNVRLSKDPDKYEDLSGGTIPGELPTNSSTETPYKFHDNN